MACPTQCVNAGAVQKVMEFFACPEFLKFFNINPDTVDKILKSDFNCGMFIRRSFTRYLILSS